MRPVSTVDRFRLLSKPSYATDAALGKGEDLLLRFENRGRKRRWKKTGGTREKSAGKRRSRRRRLTEETEEADGDEARAGLRVFGGGEDWWVKQHLGT